MVNIVNSITTSLLSAQTRLRAADTVVDVFESAKARGDQATMERALSYAGPAVSDALRYSDELRDDLRKAVAAAREEARKQTEEALGEDKENTVTTAEQGNGESGIDENGTATAVTENSGVQQPDAVTGGYLPSGAPGPGADTAPQSRIDIKG
ncbi:MAG: hypothetical protein JW863_06355 [Chitinispirillaceae bacterium]|nr:hypothetical protein [Chitinispirillaceae bacterium]